MPVSGRRPGARARPGAVSSEHRGGECWSATFFTVETVFLKTLSVLLFIELSTRRVHAIQHGLPILSMITSFQEESSGLDHQDPMPDVPGCFVGCTHT